VALGHCTPGGAGSRPQAARLHRDHCCRVLPRRHPTLQTLPCHRATHTTSDGARRSNPHRPNARHHRGDACPRFPPLRLLGRLPPEPLAPSSRGRHPRTLNTTRHSRAPARTSSVKRLKGDCPPGGQGGLHHLLPQVHSHPICGNSFTCAPRSTRTAPPPITAMMRKAARSTP
jgi:hypothetical protein